MSQIKVGDLVQIVHQCCDGWPTLGLIFEVKAVHSNVTLRCCFCGWKANTSTADNEPTLTTGAGGSPLSWLKRIPPLSELEGEKKDERIEA